LEKIDDMTQEEFKVISEVVKESKNIPNAKLEETMNKLTSEFETTKNTIIGMSFYLDKLEELYNNLLKEYNERTNG
jgi:flagellar motor switch protein FliG